MSRLRLGTRAGVAMGLVLGTALLWAPAARAQKNVARVGQDIVVTEGVTAGNVACAFCSVRVHGDVAGNVAVAFGDLEVDAGRQISGNVALLGGEVRLREGSRVGGNVAIVGRLREGDGAVVGGSRAVLPSVVLWLPILLLAGLIWLVVSLVRRNRYGPVYPPGYPRPRL
ncbi:MAG TPA: hypothetical protein VNW54_15320 [Granulicella sp.]|jgi:hypothetical protein|nr:hypothetical protein [Granulicella sp.]